MFRNKCVIHPPFLLTQKLEGDSDDFSFPLTLLLNFIIIYLTKCENSIFRCNRPKWHFHTRSERITRVASCIEPYFSLQMHAKPELDHPL